MVKRPLDPNNSVTTIIRGDREAEARASVLDPCVPFAERISDQGPMEKPHLPSHHEDQVP